MLLPWDELSSNAGLDDLDHLPFISQINWKSHPVTQDGNCILQSFPVVKKIILRKKFKWHTSRDKEDVQYHLITGHLNIRFIWRHPVFKWCHMTWPTIWIADILDHKQAFFIPVFRPSFKHLTIWQPDTNLTFDYRTKITIQLTDHLAIRLFLPFSYWMCQITECLLYLNTETIQKPEA